MEQIILASHGKTNWSIVVPADASPSQRHAAEELYRFLFEISGARLHIRQESEAKGEWEIYVGACALVQALDPSLDIPSLGKEGFVIQTYEKAIVIAGGRERGTLYGVYSFLETYLGCRWFTQEVSRIPRRDTVAIGAIRERQVPVLEQRDTYFGATEDGDWYARNKVNGHSCHLDDIHGGRLEYEGFVHTFYKLVPPEEYFDEHPEYFSLVDGKRIREKGQLCLTNPDVLNIVVEKIKDWLRKNPKASIVSVSQNDCYNPCQCEHCRQIDEREGTFAGSLLTFVNKVAEAIEPEFPDVAIDTLAYQYARKPPKTLKARHNVIIRLCSIECCFAHPLEECDYIAACGNRLGTSNSFVEDIRRWGEISDRLYIWDYVVNFDNFLQPFPNFNVLQPNIQFFVKHHVKGLFEEGNYTPGGFVELGELRQYVLAKLMWDPNCNVRRHIREFMAGVYGMAGAALLDYFDLLHEQVAAPDTHLGIYDEPTAAYLSEEFMLRAQELFDEACRLADTPQILERVKKAELSLEFVRLARMPLEAQGRVQAVEEFFQKVEHFGIARIREWYPWEVSREKMLKGEL